MKSIIQDSKEKWCSKKIMSILFGVCAMVLSFVCVYSDTTSAIDYSTIIITFALMSGGTHALTTTWLNKQSN